MALCEFAQHPPLGRREPPHPGREVEAELDLIRDRGPGVVAEGLVERIAVEAAGVGERGHGEPPPPAAGRREDVLDLLLTTKPSAAADGPCRQPCKGDR